jgi:hypothetical protein
MRTAQPWHGPRHVSRKHCQRPGAAVGSPHGVSLQSGMARAATLPSSSLDQPDNALLADLPWSASALETTSTPHSLQAFSEPWLRRVRDVDDDTLAGLLQQLLSLRRLRNVVAIGCSVLGMGVFGALRMDTVYALLAYVVLATTVGLPVFAVGSLSVRRLFLREARRNGLSPAASMLVLTRAERRARFLAPWSGADDKVHALLRAVRDPDEAT